MEREAGGAWCGCVDGRIEDGPEKEGLRGVFFFGASREVVREAGVAVHKPAPESDVDPCAGIEATVPMPGKFRRNYFVPTPGFGSVRLVWAALFGPQIWRYRSQGTLS